MQYERYSRDGNHRRNFSAHPGIRVDFDFRKPVPVYHDFRRMDPGILRAWRIGNEVMPRWQSYAKPAIVVGFGLRDGFSVGHALDYHRAFVHLVRAGAVEPDRARTTWPEQHRTFDPILAGVLTGLVITRICRADRAKRQGDAEAEKRARRYITCGHSF